MFPQAGSVQHLLYIPCRLAGTPGLFTERTTAPVPPPSSTGSAGGVAIPMHDYYSSSRLVQQIVQSPPSTVAEWRITDRRNDERIARGRVKGSISNSMETTEGKTRESATRYYASGKAPTGRQRFKKMSLMLLRLAPAKQSSMHVR